MTEPSAVEREFIEGLRRIQLGVKGFAEEMREKGIHVGMGAKGMARCVTCDKPWPCGGSTQ